MLTINDLQNIVSLSVHYGLRVKLHHLLDGKSYLYFGHDKGVQTVMLRFNDPEFYHELTELLCNFTDINVIHNIPNQPQSIIDNIAVTADLLYYCINSGGKFDLIFDENLDSFTVIDRHITVVYESDNPLRLLDKLMKTQS